MLGAGWAADGLSRGSKRCQLSREYLRSAALLDTLKMRNVFTRLQYQVLKRISPREPRIMDGCVYANKSKVAILLGSALLDETKDKVVIDFGCGEGIEAIEIAQRGARRVIGVDMRENVLERARARAQAAGVADRCEFTRHAAERADIILSLDAFEHFEDPPAILQIMNDLLKPGGLVVASFGPTWYHPYGGHLFSVFPWAHLIFTEKALIRWRSDIRNDGATRFGEVEGGLNQMTIKRFTRLAKSSPFRIEKLEAVPIGRLRRLHNRLTREFFTSIVRCTLRKPLDSGT